MSGGADLLCERCNGVLVAGFVARSLVGINLECFRCKTIKTMESWPDSEPLPASLLTLGRTGRYLISEPLDKVSKPVVMTSDQEIERIAELTGVRPAASDRFDFSPAGLTSMSARLDVLTEGALSRATASVQRARKLRREPFMDCIPAWALEHLLHRLRSGTIDLSSADGIALRFLQLMDHLIGRWQHHLLFGQFINSMMTEFHHTIGTLLAASYLADVGNPIGFTNLKTVTGRSPDLFINISGDQRASIEVKAPKVLQWPNAGPMSASRMEAILDKQCRDARDQLGPSGGVVVIVSSSFHSDTRAVMESAAKSLVARRKVSSRIAAITGICQTSISFVGPDPAGGLKMEGIGHIWVERNPRYSGPLSLVDSKTAA